MRHLYKAKSELRPKGLDGISEDQIEQHWKLYEGYVKNLNALGERLAEHRKRGDFGPEFSELKRRVAFELDGMVLHEHYFGILRAGQAKPKDSTELVKRMKADFGGFDSWKKEFTAAGKMRGIGWAILYYDPKEEVLANHWITLHEHGHPAGHVPVLVMDVWEHAYMVDHGADGRPDYIEAFFRNVDWEAVDRHLVGYERHREAFVY